MFRYGSPSHSRAERGFPIRTSWDQSSVINSPRLIADSHVLLRLLMPRHPPCALKNLTITHNHHTNPTRIDTANDCVHTQNLRCSRPLCSSQTTTPVNTPPTPHNPKQTGSRREQTCPGKPETPTTQPPPRTTHTNRANHPQQKPGSCCLRTQQCATQ